MFWFSLAFAAELSCEDAKKWVQQGKSEETMLESVASSEIAISELECMRDIGLPVRVLVAIGQQVQMQQQPSAGPETRPLSYYAWLELLEIDLIVTTSDQSLSGFLLGATEQEISLQTSEGVRHIPKSSITSVSRTDGRAIHILTPKDVEDVSEESENSDLYDSPKNSRQTTGTGLVLGGAAVGVVGLISLMAYQSELKSAVNDVTNGEFESATNRSQQAQGLVALCWASTIIAPPMLLGGVLVLTLPERE